MYKLIKNENMKIFGKKGSWIMIFAIISITLISALIQFKTNPQTPENWKASYEQQIESSKQALASPFIPEFQKKELEKSIRLNQYIVEHEISPKISVWEQVEKDTALITLVALFTSVIAGISIASEFSQGTIKMLLIRPISRNKILLSKYLAVLLYGLILFTVLLLSSILFNGLLYGFTGAVKPYLYIGPQGDVVSVDMISRVIQSYSLKTVQIVMYATLAFMLSVLSRSKTLAVGVSMVAVILGPQLTSAFVQYSWAKYILFAHTDPSLILGSNPYGVTFVFALIILTIYFVAMNGISWTVFSRRDVAN